MTRTILDCDPGNSIPQANVDDSLTLAVLAGLRPLHVIDSVVTVFGNTPAEVGFGCATTLLADLNYDLDVRCGQRKPLSGNAAEWSRKLHHPVADADEILGEVSDASAGSQVAGSTPDFPTESESADFALYDGARIIAIGPLTNVAYALSEGFRPESIYLMGGALGFGDLVDTNFAVDPRAAAEVLESDVPLTIIPLDITRTTCLTLKRWNAIDAELRAEDRHIADAIDSWLRPWIEYSQRTRPVDGMWVHDLVALVAYLIDGGHVPASVLSRTTASVAVDAEIGKLTHSDHGRDVSLATAVDNDALIDFIHTALRGLVE